MLPAAHLLEDAIGLLAGHRAFGNSDVQPLARMAGADVSQHSFGLAGVGRSSQAVGFLGGEPAGRHHLVGLLDYPFESRRLRRGLVAVHVQHVIET